MKFVNKRQDNKVYYDSSKSFLCGNSDVLNLKTGVVPVNGKNEK